MAKPTQIELPGQDPIPILYEDRAILAIDKPSGWMLVPVSWQKTERNLQAALLSSIAAGHFWARSRQIKFLRYIHRLDAETSGVLLFAKSIGALNTFADLFETRKMEKIYLAVTSYTPKQAHWTCRASLTADPKQIGRMIVSASGKKAETEFRVVGHRARNHLIEARPYTGRTHQIRVHMAESGCPVLGDLLYGSADTVPGKRSRSAPQNARLPRRPDTLAPSEDEKEAEREEFVEQHSMALRAVGLGYIDPFKRKPVAIRAPQREFLRAHGFEPDVYQLKFESLPATSRRADSAGKRS